jgi:hypothetical protein
VKRIRCRDFIGNGLRTATGGLRFSSLFQFSTESFGDILDFILVGKAFEEAFAQDLIDFVGCEVNWSDAPLLPAKFGTCIFELRSATAAGDERRL